MMSPPNSPPMSRNESENRDPTSPPLSPKRSYSQDEDDTSSDLGLKRRHVLTEKSSPRRSPLDPLSASDLENRPNRQQRWGSSSPRQLLRTSVSVPDFQPLRCGQADKRGPYSGDGVDHTSVQICSWPPPMGSSDSLDRIVEPERPRLNSRAADADSADAATSLRQAVGDVCPAWPPSEPQDAGPTLYSERPAFQRRSSSSSDKVAQPIRFRSNSLPVVRCPPQDLWQTSPSHQTRLPSFLSPGEHVRTVYGLMAESDSIMSNSPPPGLPPRPTDQRRRASDPASLGIGSTSLSLASGSQLVDSTERARVVAPIGAERSRVVSMTLRGSRTATTPGMSPSKALAPSLPPPSCSSRSIISVHSPKSQPTSLYHSSSAFPFGDTWSSPHSLKPYCHTRISRTEFGRLLLQAKRNRWAPKVMSPLSPLRYPIPEFVLTANPDYLARVPSPTNRPSPRYYREPPQKRSRSICDVYLPRDPEIFCTHCQECKRDTLGKKLLARKYHSRSLGRRVSYGWSYDKPVALADTSDNENSDGDSLWHEVAAATSTEPFPHSGSHETPASPRSHDHHDFDDDEYPEIPDEDLFSDEESGHDNESRSLF
ncbi:hypothetical protein BV22DRAFT_1193089 [Leucogyrophana mollusca]|uniref:Uncharacterized protein n=1 Tax=Leucogyrophana mollusca TaxID=85980 RepID=A0ACB8BRA0_9AGAM|nr:hypothetical protein BV22DRAFT_1193089 [Leucogyrophana mollusca]